MIYLTSHQTIQSVVIMLPSNLKSALNSTIIQFCNYRYSANALDKILISGYHMVTNW